MRHTNEFFSKVCTSRPAHVSTTGRDTSDYKKNAFNINIENLNTVVTIDIKKQEVFVEPRCDMAHLHQILLPLGYSLPIVPELSNLTVGGLIVGTDSY